MKMILLEHILRLSLIWGVLLLFYKYYLSANDNWTIKRVFILVAYLLGWTIPLLPTLYTAPAMPVLTLPTGVIDGTIASGPTISTSEGNIAANWHYSDLLLLIYLVGVVWQVFRLSLHFLRIYRWKSKGLRSQWRTYSIIQHEKIASPFAGQGCIFLPIDVDPQHLDMICLHEATHLKNRHNLERIPFVIGQVLLWFHPLQWYFQYEQEAIQEYEVDEEVTMIFPPTAYGRLLIQSSMMPATWHPKLFSSSLKNRINMIVKQKNKRPWRKQHSFSLLALLTILVFSCSDLVKDVDLLENNLTVNDVDRVPHLIVEEADQDQAPEKRIFKAIGMTIKYPAIARKSGNEGIFLASFLVNKDGKMEDLQVSNPYEDKNQFAGEDVFDSDKEIVITGYGRESIETSSFSEASQEVISEMEQEIKNTLLALPDWEPAQKDGEAVPVRMGIILKFRLQ